MGLFALIGGGILAVAIYIYRRASSIILPPIEDSDLIEKESIISDCSDDCPCKKHTPHYHWIDLHRDILQNHPNCFVALHPENGIMFFDSDIEGFAIKYGESNTDRHLLMVLHTSMLATV
jgi:hypothetical protein